MGAAGQPPSIFSEACKLHEVIDSNTLFSAEIGDTKLYAALVDWFFNGTRYTVSFAADLTAVFARLWAQGCEKWCV